MEMLCCGDTKIVKVVALMCDLHELLVGELKEFLKEKSFSYTKRRLRENRSEAVKMFRWIAN